MSIKQTNKQKPIYVSVVPELASFQLIMHGSFKTKSGVTVPLPTSVFQP